MENITALMTVAMSQQKEGFLLKLLQCNEIKLNITDILIYQFYHENYMPLFCLLKHGLDPANKNADGNTLLSVFLLINREDAIYTLPIARMMQAKREIINSQNNNGDTPLMIAIAQGDSRAVYQMIAYNKRYASEKYALEQLSEFKQYCHFELCNKNGDTALSLAFKFLEFEIASLLIKGGANFSNALRACTDDKLLINIRREFPEEFESALAFFKHNGEHDLAAQVLEKVNKRKIVANQSAQEELNISINPHMIFAKVTIPSTPHNIDTDMQDAWLANNANRNTQ
jgi:ankyrin repeat protein